MKVLSSRVPSGGCALHERLVAPPCTVIIHSPHLPDGSELRAAESSTRDGRDHFAPRWRIARAPGDYISYYTALLYGTDPTPVNVIDYLKGRLAQI